MERKDITELARINIRKMKAIEWGTTTEGLILKWGENLLPPSKNVIRAIRESASRINIYPDPLKNELLEALSEYTNLEKENILITNGADKAFRLLAETFVEKDDEAITFSPSYPVFDSAIELSDK